MKFTKQLFSVLFIASMLFACSPDDGRDGATGSKGEQGEPGEAGADGAQGDTGTANVIYSDWIVRDFDIAVASETNQQLIATLGLNDIDFDEDVLLVYGRNEVNVLVSEVYQLPYILASQQEYYGFNISSFNGGYSLRIQVSTLDGGSNLFTFFDDFRYVIIPGGNPVSSNRNGNSESTGSKSSGLDYTTMTYQEIIDHFNIPD